MSEVADCALEFLEEASELVLDCELAYSQLSGGGFNQELLSKLFRNLHTIKGSSGVVGFDSLSQFVHHLEDIISNCMKQETMNEDILTVLLEANDYIGNWLENLMTDPSYDPPRTDMESRLLALRAEQVTLPDNVTPMAPFGFFSEHPSPEEDNPKNPQFNVLIVDDDRAVLSFLKNCLKRLPFNILTSQNTREALEIFEKNPIDVIVSDLSMPDIDGIEFISNIRKTSQKVEVVFISAHADKRSLEKFIQLNTFAFIEKGGGQLKIINTIVNAMKSKKVADAVSKLTKFNMDIYIDFNLMKHNHSRSLNVKKIEERIHKKLQMMAELSSIIGDPELILQTKLKDII